MPSTRPFPELRAKIPREVLARAERRATELKHEMNQAQLREALKISKQHLAKILRIDRRHIAKVVKHIDMRLSALAAALRAKGGDRQIP